MAVEEREVDVCLVLEGTYPYITGGVSSWAHELLRNQSHLTFSLVCILAPGSETVIRYEIPENVVNRQDIFVQDLPPGNSTIPDQKKFFVELQSLLLKMHVDAGLNELLALDRLFKDRTGILGSQVLLNSQDAWQMLQEMYNEIFVGGSFIDFFWSWRGIYGALFSILNSDIPRARCYHSLCTGYAGLYAARASLRTGRPCLITEHGIYTNERRIELSVADWLHDRSERDLSIERSSLELRDYWLNIFAAYSRICYSACSKIITLYEENQKFQLTDGADASKLKVIPNGIDFERFSAIKRDPAPRPVTIALIGRVVPIKDIKGFIAACRMIHDRIANLEVLIMGPTDEDPVYFRECQSLVEHFHLQEVIKFVGRVKLDDYLGRVDLTVLTSISEAQPLVILEAGAAGIPAVATNVGACSEIIYGRSDENPSLGPGGAITGLSNPRSVAKNVIQLIEDAELRRTYGAALRERVKRYYNKVSQHRDYAELYSRLLDDSPTSAIASEAA